MMKKHLFKSLLLICGLAFFSSCLKDEPNTNATIYYGYQQIPNINEYMPQRLLNAFGDEFIHFGDEPPKIEGKFVGEAFLFEKNVKIDSLWRPRIGQMMATDYFEFYDQHKGIAKYRFKRPYIDAQTGTLLYLENSSNDSTTNITNSRDRFDLFVNDSISPSYFKSGQASKSDFGNIYIIGNDPFFTIYYYEVRDINSKTRPLHAVIISGKVGKETVTETDPNTGTTTTKEQTIIQDFRIGFQSMMYYNKESFLYPSLIANGSLALPGNVWIVKCLNDLHYGEYQE